MNRFKKLSIVFIMVMLITCIATNKTYATLNCNVNLSAPKNKVTYEEQFSVYVSISNLQTTNGIIAIGAVVSYDTDSLTLVSIEGQNNWSNPFHNSSNGKITSFKSELSTKDENVFKITFKVNEKGKAKTSAWIKISDFEISDGEEEKNCGESSINIKIEEQESTNTGNNNQGNNNQGNNNQGNNSQESNNQGNNGQTSNNTKKPEDNQTTKPSTGTTKPVENNSINETTAENINTNNVNTNSIENVVGEDSIDNESKTNNVQNVFEDNAEESKENKTMNKGVFYIISVIAVIAIIVILFVIVKYWRTK